jgi:hypothetical protein
VAARSNSESNCRALLARLAPSAVRSPGLALRRWLRGFQTLYEELRIVANQPRNNQNSTRTLSRSRIRTRGCTLDTVGDRSSTWAPAKAAGMSMACIIARRDKLFFLQHLSRSILSRVGPDWPRGVKRSWPRGYPGLSGRTGSLPARLRRPLIARTADRRVAAAFDNCRN